MSPEDEAKILQDSAEGWKRANISRVKAEMERYGLQMSDLAPCEADTIPAMVKLLEPHNPALAQRNTVASE